MNKIVLICMGCISIYSCKQSDCVFGDVELLSWESDQSKFKLKENNFLAYSSKRNVLFSQKGNYLYTTLYLPGEGEVVKPSYVWISPDTLTLYVTSYINDSYSEDCLYNHKFAIYKINFKIKAKKTIDKNIIIIFDPDYIMVEK